MKTGVGIEETQLSTYERITALLGILAVVAVWLMALKSLARVRPDAPLPADVLESDEVRVLELHRGRPPGGWTAGAVLRMIACLGGFLDRKGDGPPGWLTLWRGWQRLRDLVEGYRLAVHGHRLALRPPTTMPRAEKCG